MAKVKGCHTSKTTFKSTRRVEQLPVEWFTAATRGALAGTEGRHFELTLTVYDEAPEEGEDQ